MKKYKIVFFLVLLPFLGQSQIEQPKRIEIELESNSRDYEMIPVGKHGLLLFASDDEGNSKTPSSWTFQLLDADFKNQWEKKVSINSRLHFNEYYQDKNIVYLLFTNYKSEEYHLLKVDAASGMIDEIEGTYLRKFSINSFKVKNNNMYLLGYYKGKEELGYINLQSKTFTLAPMSFEGPTSIENLSFEKDSEIATVVYLTWYKKKSFITIASFEGDKKLNSIRINPVDDKNIMSARINTLENKEKLIIGTYSEGGRSSNGMYICKFSNENQEYIKFYNFKVFENFLSHLTVREQDKIKEKMEKKESKGKEFNFNYRLLVHDVIEKENQYVLISEAYYPTYRTEYYTTMVAGPNGTMRPVTQTRQVFDGWMYTHALIAGFDKEGTLIWDNSFEMGDFKSFVLKERIKVNTEKSDIVLAYGFSNTIRTKMIRGNTVLDGKEREDVKTLFNEDKVKRAVVYNMEFWYDKYFIIWGYQRIKNKEETDKVKRDVFYFNKVAYSAY